ncbi:MAG: TrpR-like protein [Oscillibacter sp.]|nr:TrpR-like protein [Oscillibacter sp.]
MIEFLTREAALSRLRATFPAKWRRGGGFSVVKERKPYAALYETILKLKDLDECTRFFQDLCTPIELRSMEQRFEVAVELERGAVYSEVLERTGASSATVSRVRRSMLDGGAGGVMRKVIAREGFSGVPEGET